MGTTRCPWQPPLQVTSQTLYHALTLQSPPSLKCCLGLHNPPQPFWRARPHQIPQGVADAHKPSFCQGHF